MATPQNLNNQEQSQLRESEYRVWKTSFNVVTIVIVLGGLGLISLLNGGVLQSALFIVWVVVILLWSAIRRYWLQRVQIKLNDKYHVGSEWFW